MSSQYESADHTEAGAGVAGLGRGQLDSLHGSHHGGAKNTVAKLPADVGATCAAYQDKTLRNLPRKRLQIDEI